MRISNNQLFFTVLQNVQRPRRTLIEITERLSSGKRINRFADDPAAAGELEKLRSQKRSVQQYERNIENGMSWLQQTESVLGQLEDRLIRAKSLAITAANASKSAEDRKSISKEIDQILEEVVSMANTRVGDRYLFAGRHTTAQPYIAHRDSTRRITGVTAATDLSGLVAREVDQHVQVTVNVPGNQAFDLQTGPIPTLIALRDALELNDVEAIQASLDDLDQVSGSTLKLRVQVGATLNRLEASHARHIAGKVELTRFTSIVEDADYGELAMRLAIGDVSQRAALGAASRIVQTSLVDLLT